MNRPNLLKSARRSWLAAALTLILAASPEAVLAQSSVRVLVNDEPITSFDIQNRGKMLQLFSRGKQGEKEAIEQLIDERLMMQEARRRNVSISDEEVEQEFASRATQAKLTPEQFQQAFRQSGVDPKTFKNFIRANRTWNEIVRARFRATVDVSDQDVSAALSGKDLAGEQTTISEYMVQQILFIVPAKAKSGVQAEQRNRANAFRSAFTGCDNSLQQVGGTPGVVVKPTVRREETKLPQQLREALASVGVGGITEVQPVEEGFQLLAVCAKKEIAGRTQATEEARGEIASERGQLLARRYLRDLRSEAVIEYR
jgi:peptidyl-prolyl cis-trans isomerase SurA